MTPRAPRPRPVRIGLLAGHLPTYLAAQHHVVDRASSALRAAAAALGADVVVEPQPVVGVEDASAAAARLVAGGADALVVLHASFTMGDVTRAALAGTPPEVPVAAWALAEPSLEGAIQLNGFVSAHLGTGIERLDRGRDRASGRQAWLFGLPDDPHGERFFTEGLAALVARARVGAALAAARIGLVGGVAPSFFPFEVDHAALRERHGVRVEEAPFAEVAERALAAPGGDVREVVVDLSRRCGGRVRTSAGDLEATARTALALRSLAAERGWNALAVSDWPEAQERLGIHPGAAFSWLDEVDGTPVACEGDVLGVTTMVALSAVSGLPAALLDVATVDPGTGTALLWHCGGAPASLAAPGWPTAVIDHSTLGRGVPGGRLAGAVLDLVLADGPATVARIDRDGRRCTAFEVEVSAAAGPAPGFDGTRGWATGFTTTAGEPRALVDVVDALLGGAADHHVVLTPGRVGADLAAWAAGAGVSLVGP